MSAKFKDIARRVSAGEPIGEGELAIFVRGNSRGVARSTKEFAVIWYDADQEDSTLLHVEARDSVEALEKTKGLRPSFVNVSVYPTRLPEQLKIVPDSKLQLV